MYGPRGACNTMDNTLSICRTTLRNEAGSRCEIIEFAKPSPGATMQRAKPAGRTRTIDQHRAECGAVAMWLKKGPQYGLTTAALARRAEKQGKRQSVRDGFARGSNPRHVTEAAFQGCKAKSRSWTTLVQGWDASVLSMHFPRTPTPIHRADPVQGSGRGRATQSHCTRSLGRHNSPDRFRK